ncbi:HIG1 domain family member 2A, mitochondrial-like isoform X2 [Dermatophagoides pteronyssinus]|uniref:HIG1 domain family member 2A, mitochondrial-like isoform X2 n=1 Tax=Dermatophagoides pteronyssinus TaxID=6956 RepID=UPI003F672A64
MLSNDSGENLICFPIKSIMEQKKSTTVATVDDEMSSLEWIELQKTIDDYSKTETFFQKAKRRTLENPIAPLGFIGACGFLGFGLRALNRGDSRQQQFMMRGRVIAQAIGIGSIMIGLWIAARNEQKQQ